MSQHYEVELTPEEYSVNTLRAIVKAVPHIGQPLEQFLFGPLVELRMKRIERTLEEIAEGIKAHGGASNINTEEFANLLEAAIPHLGREVGEERRQCFRNLLINAATSANTTSDWQEAGLALRLLEEIEEPGLAILAALHAAPQDFADWDKDKDSGRYYIQWMDRRLWPNEQRRTFPYDAVIVHEWVERLADKRLIRVHEGYDTSDSLQLLSLGTFLVRWTLADTSHARPVDEHA